MPLVKEFGKQRQVHIYGFEASLVYLVSFRIARTVQRNPIPQTNKQTLVYLCTMNQNRLDIIQGCLRSGHLGNLWLLEATRSKTQLKRGVSSSLWPA